MFILLVYIHIVGWCTVHTTANWWGNIWQTQTKITANYFSADTQYQILLIHIQCFWTKTLRLLCSIHFILLEIYIIKPYIWYEVNCIQQILFHSIKTANLSLHRTGNICFRVSFQFRRFSNDIWKSDLWRYLPMNFLIPVFSYNIGLRVCCGTGLP